MHSEALRIEHDLRRLLFSADREVRHGEDFSAQTYERITGVCGRLCNLREILSKPDPNPVADLLDESQMPTLEEFEAVFPTSKG